MIVRRRDMMGVNTLGCKYAGVNANRRKKKESYGRCVLLRWRCNSSEARVLKTSLFVHKRRYDKMISREACTYVTKTMTPEGTV